MDPATILSVLIGGAITWLVSWFYYRRAGRELRQEAAELRRLSALILDALETAGIAALTRDSVGRIVGITIRGTGSITLTPIVQGRAHVTPPPNQVE
jgi:hypothetical protein